MTILLCYSFPRSSLAVVITLLGVNHRWTYEVNIRANSNFSSLLNGDDMVVVVGAVTDRYEKMTGAAKDIPQETYHHRMCPKKQEDFYDHHRRLCLALPVSVCLHV